MYDAFRNSKRNRDRDTNAEFAQLGPTGYRPLRVRDTLF